MVALEALKTSTAYLLDDIHTIKNRITSAQHSVEVENNSDVWQLMEDSNALTISTTHDVDHMMGVCRDNQQLLSENKGALILFCQQFAFAPEMAEQCAALLTCAET